MQKIPPEILSVYHSSLSKPNWESLLKLLQILIRTFTRTFIIVDALDEIAEQERRPLFKLIEQMLDVHANILLTGRRESYIIQGLLSKNFHEVCLEANTVDDDIRQYVIASLDYDPKFNKWKPELKSNIIDGLTNGSKGM